MRVMVMQIRPMGMAMGDRVMRMVMGVVGAGGQLVVGVEMVPVLVMMLVFMRFIGMLMIVLMLLAGDDQQCSRHQAAGQGQIQRQGFMQECNCQRGA